MGRLVGKEFIMKRKYRGLIAIVCIIALVIGSFATYNTKTKASSDYKNLDYQSTESIYTYDHQTAKIGAAWAICEDESTPAMATAAENFSIRTYSDHYAEVSWAADSPYASPNKVTVNGIDYTSQTDPIHTWSNVVIQVDTTHSAGFTTGYNTVNISVSCDIASTKTFT